MDNKYLSDDENEEKKEMTFDEMYPDEEIDESTMEMIYQKSKKNNDDLDMFSFGKNKKKDKQEKPKPTINKGVISYKDILKVDTENTLSTIKEKKKRCFNPRLHPYMSVKKSKSNNNYNIDDNKQFPDL